MTLDHDDVREAEFGERGGYEPHAGAVHRRVDDLHIVELADAFGREGEFMHLVQVDFVEAFVEDRDLFGVAAREDHADVGDLLHLGDDVLVVGRGNLCAVGPVGLVTVVLLGVVGGGYNDTRVAFEFADGEAQLGRRTECVEEEYRKSVRCEDIGHAFGEHARIVAAVVGHGDADLLARKVLFKVVRETLRGGSDRIDVHAVRTHAHDAAQASRTEFEILVEALYEFFHVVVHQVFDLFLGLLVIGAVEPCLGFFQHQLFQFVCHNLNRFYL